MKICTLLVNLIKNFLFNVGRYILTYYCKKDVWYYAGELPEYRIFHSAVLVNNKIYIIGIFSFYCCYLCHLIIKSSLISV